MRLLPTEQTCVDSKLSSTAALPTDPAQTWTGTAGSNPGQNCGNPIRSISQFQFILLAQGATTGNYSVTGHAVNDVDATQAKFKGTAQIDATGTGTMSFTVDPPADYARGSGTLSGSTWSGTYQGGSPSLCEQGTWTATRLK